MTNLDITCDIFVSDLSKALKEVAGGRDVNVDTTLLPVDSVLKKMLDRTNGTKTKPPDVRSKKTRTRKEHVPFYNLNDQLTPFADIVKLYNLGKNTLLSDDPSDWRLECTSVDEEGYREYDAEIDQNDDAFDKRISEILKMENSERIRALKAPFLKSAIQLMRNSVTNRIFFIDSVKKYSIENPVTMLSLGDTKDDGIISSFAQMSLHDDPSENIQQSFHEMEELESDDLNHDLVDDNNFAEQSFIDENTLQNLMVEPPVLVKPSFIKFEKKQTNVDTDLVKKEMFHIISSSFEKHTGDSNSGAYFSEVYTELKKKQFKMSMQYAFVILLLLSNEKCLSLESMKDSSDILILQDINEVE
ncbi:uncharacterized protein LOC129219274 [Uloborus diversus]|uniref:uncharacterized protein LOC129219274 n=1 Tax=Uloborus diversus TaxID=327109 RepID=UPI002409B341|nr:uncharacterized protein LOC129219274 [Uloborus diversus]